MPLIRPAEFDDQSKLLGGILSTKAAQGVKVFILMYNEVTLATSLDTSYQFETIKKLEGKENIYVTRHPEHKLSTSSVWFWSHHEKSVVVISTMPSAVVLILAGVDTTQVNMDYTTKQLPEHSNGQELTFPTCV